MRREAAAQLDRWPLWAPVAFGGGAAVYFGLLIEPPLWLPLLLLLCAVGLALAARRFGAVRMVGIGCALLAFMAAGFAAAKVRTLRAAAPIVPALKAVTVEGWVVDVAAPSRTGQRMVIAPVAIGDLSAAELPNRIRITVTPDALMGWADGPARGRGGVRVTFRASAPNASRRVVAALRAHAGRNARVRDAGGRSDTERDRLGLGACGQHR